MGGCRVYPTSCSCSTTLLFAPVIERGGIKGHARGVDIDWAHIDATWYCHKHPGDGSSSQQQQRHDDQPHAARS